MLRVQPQARRSMPPDGWPPDDTEESVLGTILHQATISNLRLGLIEVASLLAPPDQPHPWQALTQTGIAGLRRWDGSPYTVLPDVFVYRHAVDEGRAILSLAEEGPPALVAEVLSPTTAVSDLDLVYGKGYSYAQAGVPEYLMLDPFGEFVPEQVRGWRLEAGRYAPWLPEPTGRWQSREIEAAIGFEGVRVVVYSREGVRQLREEEIAREALARQRREDELAGEIAELREALSRQQAEIAALHRRLERGE